MHVLVHRMGGSSSKIISGSMDGTIRVWDAKSGKELKSLETRRKNNEAQG